MKVTPKMFVGNQYFVFYKKRKFIKFLHTANILWIQNFHHIWTHGNHYWTTSFTWSYDISSKSNKQIQHEIHLFPDLKKTDKLLQPFLWIWIRCITKHLSSCAKNLETKFYGADQNLVGEWIAVWIFNKK